MNKIQPIIKLFKVSLTSIVILMTMTSSVKCLAQKENVFLNPNWAQDPPVLSTLVEFANTESEMRVAITRYLEDYATLDRRYPVQYSPVREKRFREFFK